MQRLMLTLLVLMPLVLATSALASPPKDLISERYKEIQRIIGSEKNDAAVREKVTKVLESFTDFNEFGRMTLKKWWKDLSAKDRQRFVSRYRRLIHKSYVKRFKANQKLALTFRGEPKIVGDKALVRTTVMSGKTEAEVDYKLHKTKAGFRAYDIVIDQVSLMRSYRKQFSKIMKRDGFKALLKKMDKKLKDGASSGIDTP